jgi:hypothetical protein
MKFWVFPPLTFAVTFKFFWPFVQFSWPYSKSFEFEQGNQIWNLGVFFSRFFMIWPCHGLLGLNDLGNLKDSGT